MWVLTNELMLFLTKEENKGRKGEEKRKKGQVERHGREKERGKNQRQKVNISVPPPNMSHN